MVNYLLGKIYKIQKIGGCDSVYIGSTTKKYLSERFTDHRYKYKNKRNSNFTCFNLFDEYDLSNCEIVLIENYPCDTKDELLARERYYIETLNCVNKMHPGRTAKEYYNINKEKAKEYYNINKEKIKERTKEYNNINKEKIKENRLIYKKENKDKIRLQGIAFRTNNKEKIKLQRQKYYKDHVEQIKLITYNNKDRTKQYRESNKEILKEKRLIYEKVNKDKIKERKRLKYISDKQL
jgi:hypothetical protein